MDFYRYFNLIKIIFMAFSFLILHKKRKPSSWPWWGPNPNFQCKLSSAVLRRHPAPPVSNFDPLVHAAAARGFSLKCNNSKELADSLDAAQDPSDPMVNTVLRILSTRSMMQAVYFCTGFESDCWHYGLAAPIYTHFTSPIRRFADIMVSEQFYKCFFLTKPVFF